MAPNSKVHILAVPFPNQGSLNGMMHLCKYLANEGFIITVATIESIHHNMKTLWSPKSEHDIRLHALAFNWRPLPTGSDSHELDNLAPYFNAMLEESFQKQLEDLATTLTPKVSVILSDYFMSVTQKVAAKCKVERVLLWSGSADWSLVEYFAPLIHEKGHLPTKGDGLVSYIQGIGPLYATDLPIYYRVQDHAFVETILNRSPTIKDASWVLVNSFYNLEPKIFDCMRGEIGENYVPVGPLLHLDQHDDGKIGVTLRPECDQSLEWLDAHKPNSVLYISFGGIHSLTDLESQEICAGMEACGVPFLWATGEDNQANEVYRNFSKKMEDKGKLTSWVAQPKVLAHPSIGAYLTKGGWNSILESIYAGVPLIVWPFHVEQNLNAKLICEDWEVGLRLKEKPHQELGRSLERSVNEIMGEGGTKLRENMKLLQLKARKSITEKEEGSSLANLHKFVEYLENLV